MIAFPFGRRQFYPIGDLRDFEAHLLAGRQQDSTLSQKWRCPAGPEAELIRLRNDELVPFLIFADHKRLSDSDSFCISAHGDPIDIRVRTASEALNLQITVADLDWCAPGQNPGHQYRLSMEALNKYWMVSGHGPFERAGEEIVGPAQVYSNEDRLEACRRGLVRAFKRKEDHDGSGCCLLVYARNYHMQTIDAELNSVVNSAIANCQLPVFDRIYVIEKGDGCFVEVVC